MEGLPEGPSEADCCGSGCNPCIFDVYEQLKHRKHQQSLQEEDIRHDLLSPTRYNPFKILHITPYAHNISCFRIQPHVAENLNGFLPYTLAQHIFITTAFAANESEANSQISRQYTILTNAKNESNCIMEFMIKFYPDGKMSKFLKPLKEGEILHVRGPFGNFKYCANKYEKMVMFCAGTGIAPMYTVLREVLENERDETRVQMHYASPTFDQICFRDELREFTRYWNFVAYLYLSKEDNPNLGHSKPGENILYRKIEKDVVEKVLRNLKNVLVLICGTDSFNHDMKQFTENLGIHKEQVHVF